ncbi:unknown [Ruminococcus sp. CAG:17]|nr:unknown [Ruminococcus sp. CAG:17]
MAGGIQLQPLSVFFLKKTFYAENISAGRVVQDLFCCFPKFLFALMNIHKKQGIKSTAFCIGFFHIIFCHIPAVQDLFQIFVCKIIPVFIHDFAVQTALTLDLTKCTVEMFLCAVDLFLCSFLTPAQKYATCICHLRSQQIIRFRRKILRKLGIHNSDHISDLIPLIQWFLMEGVKKLIHIKDSGWFHDHTVITAHSHGDQFCLKSTSVTVRVTSTRNHLQLTVVSHQILKQHHIHIYCPEIIFQDTDVHAFFQKIGGIFFYKCCLPGSEKSGYQINFYHISSFTLSQ